ncbi:GIP [Symbiodinium sp. CCMP2592]|nr:GIP [Symbiodinium sp. CCMP2592]
MISINGIQDGTSAPLSQQGMSPTLDGEDHGSMDPPPMLNGQPSAAVTEGNQGAVMENQRATLMPRESHEALLHPAGVSAVPSSWSVSSVGCEPIEQSGRFDGWLAVVVACGIPYDENAVQAEVAKQLDAAMGGVLQRLQVEKLKTEEAMQEAQRLRRQLEIQEARMNMQSSYVMVAPEHPLPMVSPGVLAEVPPDQPPRGPYEGNVVKLYPLQRRFVYSLLSQVMEVFDYLEPRDVNDQRDGQLLLTLARGIEALLNQQHAGKGDRPEAVKPGINELPGLPEYEPATGSIDLLHWITHIGPIMEDLSDTSSAWWHATMKDALQWYSRYSTASPLARLQLEPQPSLELSKPEWSRVERRATAMLLTAVPKSVREEIIAYGKVTSLSVLCKLYAVYQPGNLQEKGLVLRMLEQPQPCNTALEAVEGLRRWSLWRTRATTIGMAEPDASVLIRGLDRITNAVIQGSGELSFRVSLIRSTLQVDVSPSASTVTSFLQHLQAEMEQQARLGATSTGGATPSLKAITTTTTSTTPAPSPDTSTSTPSTRPNGGVCKFFAGDRGCRRGNTCRFPHTWSLLEKGARSRKCLCCGAVSHKVKDCKAPGGGATRATTTKAGAQGAGETGSTSPTASSPDASARRVTFDGEAVQTKALKVLDQVTCLPLFRSVMSAVSRWSQGTPPSPRSRAALMDSGSTHILRGPTSPEEWEKANAVQVKLAGDAVTSMRQTDRGTLLNPDDVAQVIVPLGRVISTLGFRLNWTPEFCRLEGPAGEVFPLSVTNGCPEVDDEVAKELITRLEDSHLPSLQESTEASARMLKRVRASWWSCMMDYVKDGNVAAGREAVEKASFLGYKEILQNGMVVRRPKQGIWELMKALTLNRRSRKRLLRSSSWVVRWDSPSVDRIADPLRHLSFVGETIYVNMNTLLVANEFVDLWKVVAWAATTGRISSVVARDRGHGRWDEASAALHRSKVHLMHAIASAGRSWQGGGATRLLIEDLVYKEVEIRDGASLWPAWTNTKDAQEYLEEMGIADASIDQFKGDSYVRLAKLNSDAAWRLHVARNHQPFRRDCAVCVRNSATGHQHRSTLHPMAYSLSVDVVGPLKGHGRSPDGKFFKYFVIGAMRIPQVEGAEGHPEVRGHPLPGGESEEEEIILSDDEDGDFGGGVGEIQGVDPAEEEKERKAWEDLKKTFKEPIPTTTLYFAVPVNNKKAATMLPAVQKIITEVKALGYPITRLHSDRGGEFRGHLVRRWALSQGIWPTTTSGSDSAANGVAESGVRYLKRRARILLDSSGVTRENWPTAVQYAAAQQRCDQLGVLPPMPVAYGAKVYVKTKRYKTGAVEDFGPHWTQGRYVGPSSDIRGGHVILKATGTFIQTTHVRVARDPPSLDEVTPTIVVEPEAHEDDVGEPPLPPPDVPPPPRRMRSKAPMASKVDGFYPDIESLEEVHVDLYGNDVGMPQTKYLRVGEVQYVEAIAEQFYKEEKFDEPSCARLLALVAGTCGNLKVPRSPGGEGMIVGAYVHAGSFGITRYGRDLPWMARYFNTYLKVKIQNYWPGMQFSWTTFALQAAKEIPRHKDSHNEKGIYNYVMELNTDSLEGLWVQDQGDERMVVGGENAKDHQCEGRDGQLYDGCLVSVKQKPAVFDPMVHHGYINEGGVKWFLSAYTPQGACKLQKQDQEYLKGLNFPVCDPEDVVQSADGAWETRPKLRATSLPSEVPCCGAHGHDDEVDFVTVGECEATLCDWALYTECPLDGGDDERCLKKVCASDDPGPELQALTVAQSVLDEEEIDASLKEDLACNVEHWASLGLYDQPRLAKLEPEYVENVEAIIQKAVDDKVPLRHTYNVSPQEARAAIERWRPAITKEVGVVEKGFVRVTDDDVTKLRRDGYVIQELPSKLVYTVKPPPSDAPADGENAFCKRKARVVCCGNYAPDDQTDVFASGAAAESLRSNLTYSARRKWRSGIVDVTGAFMLTPLPQGRGQVIYIVRPPAALVQLGLAQLNERWQLTHGMYGLRQSPKLWAGYRDGMLGKLEVDVEGRLWAMKKGTAETNLWMIYEVGKPFHGEPGGTILLYVDDILVSGPLSLVTAVAEGVGKLWKTSELEVLAPGRDIRFLGCEIGTNEEMDTIYIHQRPYIEEILRSHNVQPTEQSPIQAPREMVTFEAFENEDKGTEDQVKQAQRLCGELLWLAQRSRPDLSFVVSAMGSLLTRAAPRCLQIGRRLLSYLQRSKGLSLTLRPEGTEFVAFSDSSFAPEGARSHSGILLTWMNAPISWRAARQPFVCLSTAECELVASIEALTMAKSLQAVLQQLDPSLEKIVLGVDNQAAIALATPSSNVSWRTRHLRVRAAYVHEQVESDQVCIRFIPGKDQKADLLTKSFPRQRLQELVTLWGFVDLIHEVAKVAMMKAMLFCMMVQTTRASSLEPLQLDTSFELYAVVLIAGIALVALWEAVWWCWYRCCGNPESSRSGRRLRQLQETVQRELAAQMAEIELPAEPLGGARPPASTSSSSSMSSTIGRGRRSTRRTSAEVATQTDPLPPPSAPVGVREILVPQWHPGPIYVSGNGDHFHTVCNCWGLRNVHKPRRLMFCNLCQNHSGQSMY